MRGFLYVMTNQSMPQVVKIGFSTKDPAIRADDLSGTSVPTPFTVHYDVLIDDPYSLEQVIHNRLREEGFGAGKEFFSISADAAVSKIRAYIAEAGLAVLYESTKTSYCSSCSTWSTGGCAAAKIQ
jgi:hypothetical protein